MAFTNNFRIERIYFEKLKSNIDILKSYIEAGATGEALELLKNSVDVDGAVLLLYRNLGEAWAELADLIQKTQKDLKDLADKTEAYHDELNERIDEVNNYLMALIRELDARLQAVEQDLATMNRNKFYDLVENDGSYLIEKDGETVSFDEIKADADFPHDVILRYDNGISETELEIREFTDSRIDFYSIGLADSDKTVKEILVTIDDTEDVTYSEKTLENPLYTFGTGLSLDSNNELSVDFNSVQGKLTEGTGIDIDSNNEISVDTSVIQEKLTEGTGIDIDSNNEISVDTTVIQEKLTEGFGIDIDSNNEIKVDTAQVQEKLIAGQNITLTPDSTDPTKTVISATDTTYSEGTGIDIDSNNVISADTNVLQEKLTAGSGIAIDPVTNEISNTSQGVSYTFKDPIYSNNDSVILGFLKRYGSSARTQIARLSPFSLGETAFSENHGSREVQNSINMTSYPTVNLGYLQINGEMGLNLSNTTVLSKLLDIFNHNSNLLSLTFLWDIGYSINDAYKMHHSNIQKIYRFTSFNKAENFVGTDNPPFIDVLDLYRLGFPTGLNNSIRIIVTRSLSIIVEMSSGILPLLNGWRSLSNLVQDNGNETIISGWEDTSYSF